MLILVTGQTGVGKSTILQKTKLANIHYLDQIVKKIFYKRNHPVYLKIKKHFGKKYVSFLKVKIKKLAQEIFLNPQKLIKLDKLIAPYFQKYFQFFKEDKNKIHIFEMAIYLKYEKIYQKFFDKIILIKKPKPILKSKFKYLDFKPNYLQNFKIKYDFLIVNIDLQNSIKEMKNIILNKLK